MKEQTIHKRTVRVFISSTFRDMQEDRDYLVKFVFPELRRRCRQRQVEFVEVDLRWGITDRQAERGETLPRCLQIINVCRPYFIGILGERYGSVPTTKKIPADLFKAQPWLKEHADASVTELEIMHGVLNNPEMKHRAFFYFRDPSYIKKIPREKRKDYTEGKLPYREKLVKLKARIRAGGFPVHEGYPDLKTLGLLVLEDLWAAIEEEYPPLSTPTETERTAFEHESFAQNRCILHTPRLSWEKRLDEHIEKSNEPLMLIAESGMGKSALLAHWSLNYARLHPREYVLTHFIGVSPESANPVSIQQRIISELNRSFSLNMKMPERDAEVADVFFRCLQNLTARGRILLIVDALNQLEIEKAGDRLSWLPEKFPANVKLVLSSTLISDAKAVKKRGWRVIELKPPNRKERLDMIRSYLAHYKKSMEQEEIRRITALSQTSNPLFLRILLDELRVTAYHANLDEHVDRCLKSRNVPELFDLILDRWESDFNTERDALVQDALMNLVVSRRGISEREFLELLGKRENNLPLPQAYWSPFYLAMQDYLINRSGYFWFFHDHLRCAVETRYVPMPEAKCEAMFSLADFYSEKISRDRDQGGTYRRLAMEIADEAVRCSENSGNEKLVAQACMNYSSTLLSTGMGIGAENAQYFERMVQMSQKGCELAKKTGEWEILADGLVRRACDETLLNPEFGRYELVDEAIRLQRKHRRWEALRDALRDKARISMRLNQLAITENCLKEADRIEKCIKKPDPQWPKIHRHQYWGECRALQGRWKDAIRYLNTAMEGARRFGHYDGINAARGWLGLALCHLGETDKGMRMVRFAMKTERDMLQSLEVVGRWLIELGKFYDKKGNYKQALHALWLAEMIYDDLQHSLLIRTRSELDRLALNNKKVYARLRKSFNPFKTKFGRYCSLWGMPPLKKSGKNPILSPRGRGWEFGAVFNPAAWTDGRRIYLLYRAEGPSPYPGRKCSSSIGLAESTDGVYFRFFHQPVLQPTEKYEKPGGCEDPRLVYIRDQKAFYLTYTAYDGKTARLCMARCRDNRLKNWEKLGPVFDNGQWVRAFPKDSYPDLPRGWSKSGAIYPEKIGGYYWMFFGDKDIRSACSRDLQKWDILPEPLLKPRQGFFDEELVEPGPPPFLTPEGLVLIYNGAKMQKDGHLRYACGQVLLDNVVPTQVLRRSVRPVLVPETNNEKEGQTPDVVFAEGLIKFKGKLLLYYGMADSKIGVAFG